MRRQQKYGQSQLGAYAMAEIDHLKAMIGRLTDGRVLVYGGSSGNGDGDGGPGPGQPPPAAPHVLYGSKHTKALHVTAGVGLNADYEEGHVRIDETYTLVAAGSIALTDAATNYIYVNNSGVVAKNTTGFPANCIPLAEAVTAGGAIASVADRRAYLWGHHGPRFAGRVKIGADEAPTGGYDLDVEGSVCIGWGQTGIKLAVSDENFGFYKALDGNPVYMSDEGDYYWYDRVANKFNFAIDSAAVWALETNLITYFNDPGIILSKVVGPPVTVTMGFAADDFIRHDTTNDVMGLFIGGYRLVSAHLAGGSETDAYADFGSTQWPLNFMRFLPTVRTADPAWVDGGTQFYILNDAARARRELRMRRKSGGTEELVGISPGHVYMTANLSEVLKAVSGTEGVEWVIDSAVEKTGVLRWKRAGASRGDIGLNADPGDNDIVFCIAYGALGAETWEEYIRAQTAGAGLDLLVRNRWMVFDNQKGVGFRNAAGGAINYGIALSAADHLIIHGLENKKVCVTDHTGGVAIIEVDMATKLVGLPSATAAASGLLLGGDALLYRAAADTFKSPDHWRLGNITGPDTDAHNVFYIEEEFSGALAATRRGVGVYAVYNPNAPTAGFHAGLRFDAVVKEGCNQTFEWLLGIIGSVKVRGTGTKTHVLGTKVQIGAFEDNAVAGDVAFFSAGGDVTTYSGSTVVLVEGLEICDIGLGFNAVSQYAKGIHILPQTKGALGTVGIQIDDMNGPGAFNIPLWINTDTVLHGAITWGLSKDTNLYRGAADVLYSDDSLRLAGHVRVGSTTAPANVTAGDLTTARLSIGNAAFGTGTVMYVYNAVVNNASVNSILCSSTFTPTVGGAYDEYGLNVDFRYLGAVNNTSIAYALKIAAQLQGTGKPSYIGALYGTGLVARTGTAAAMSAGAVRALSFQMFGSQTRAAAETIDINSLTGIRIDSGYSGFITGDAVGDAYGIYIQQMGDAKVTNAYGLYIAGVAGAATLNLGIKLDACTTAAFWLNTDTGASGVIAWGTARDTQLYRLAADSLALGVGDALTIDKAKYTTALLLKNSAGGAGDQSPNLQFQTKNGINAYVRLADTRLEVLDVAGVATILQYSDRITLANAVRATTTLVVGADAAPTGGFVLDVVGAQRITTQLRLGQDLRLAAVNADPAYIDGETLMYFYSDGAGTDELRVRGKVGAVETQVTLANLSP